MHVPYRNSVLTSLLRDALSSNCRPVLVACVAPELQHGEESNSTCRFAARCGLMDATTAAVAADTAAAAASRAYPQLKPRLEVLQSQLKAESARAEALVGRVAELEAALASGGGSGSSGCGGSSRGSSPALSVQAVLGGTSLEQLAAVEAAVFEYLQRPPLSAAVGVGGEQAPPLRRVALAVPVPVCSAEAAPLPLSAWTPEQAQYALLLLREAVAAAVAVAGGSAGEAEELRQQLQALRAERAAAGAAQ